MRDNSVDFIVISEGENRLLELMKAIKGKHQLGRTMILYPGASPFAEKHPGIINLASIIASLGYGF